jgi:hypothetical protein
MACLLCPSAGTAMRAPRWTPLWSTGPAPRWRHVSLLLCALCTCHPWHYHHHTPCQQPFCSAAACNCNYPHRYGNEGSWVDPFVEHRGGGRSAFGVLPWGGCGLTNGDGTVLWPKDQVRANCILIQCHTAQYVCATSFEASWMPLAVHVSAWIVWHHAQAGVLRTLVLGVHSVSP